MRGAAAMWSHRRRPRGLTLIELVVAILVISFTILYTFQLFAQDLRVFQESRKKTQINRAAQGVVENIMADPAANMVPNSAPKEVTLHDKPGDPGRRYQYTLGVGNAPYNPSQKPIETPMDIGRLGLKIIVLTIEGPIDSPDQRKKLTIVTALTSKEHNLTKNFWVVPLDTRNPIPVKDDNGNDTYNSIDVNAKF